MTTQVLGRVPSLRSNRLGGKLRVPPSPASAPSIKNRLGRETALLTASCNCWTRRPRQEVNIAIALLMITLSRWGPGRASRTPSVRSPPSVQGTSFVPVKTEPLMHLSEMHHVMAHTENVHSGAGRRRFRALHQNLSGRKRLTVRKAMVLLPISPASSAFRCFGILKECRKKGGNGNEALL